MENISAPGQMRAQILHLSLMLLAAKHFVQVTRVATSHGYRLPKYVGAKVQTREEGKKKALYLAEPIAKVRYD